MALPNSKLLHAARTARRALADRTTPFIFNEWYVAGFGNEVGRHLFKRKLLGRNVLLFRTQSGQPVVLDDRCAHRSFPLSAGSLQGDTVVCGYHGFRYDAAGECIQVPSQAQCPKGIGVHRFPVVEAGPLLWVWMGEVDEQGQAPTPPPALAKGWLDSEDWARSQGYFSLKASYVNLHENLMDLTHLSYLHANTFGTADYASAPYEVLSEEGHYAVTRRVMPTQLPPV